MHVWDLRLIRDGLAAIGLDWDGPSIPGAAAYARPTDKVRVELDLKIPK
jgi:hypothetical protein